MSLKTKIIKAKVRQHIYLHPQDHNRKIHRIAAGIIFIVSIYTFAGATFHDLAQASVIKLENPGWGVRESVYREESEAAIASVDTETDGAVADEGVIGKIAQETGIDWKILKAICIKESGCKLGSPGDGGVSYGYFQIHQRYNPGTIKCAEDLECSARWTAERLKKHAHLGEWEMIRSHNGLVKDQRNAYYVEDVYKIMESL